MKAAMYAIIKKDFRIIASNRRLFPALFIVPLVLTIVLPSIFVIEKELTVALGMSLPLFQLEARQKQEKDKLKIQMSAKRQEIEKTRRLIRGLYENFVQGILTNDEYFELKADYEYAINALSGEIEVFEKSMDSLDNQLARYRAMEKDAKTLAQDHVLTAELIERLIERIEIDHERNIHVTFRFKNEFQGKAVEPCTTM